MAPATTSLRAQSIASSVFPSRAVSPATTYRSSSLASSNDAPGRRTEEADPVRTVLVLGGSYSGAHAADVLARELPKKTKGRWRVVLIERNSHFHHVYHFPRYAVVPGHAHKAFVPYTQLLSQHDRRHHNATEDEAGSDPDRFVSAVSDLKASLDAANSEALRSSRSRRSAAAPPQHHVVQASVDRIGNGFVELDRPARLPYTATSAGSDLHEHPGQEREYACGEEGCCGGRDCVEVDSGYGEENKGDSEVRSRDSRPRSAPATATTRVGWDYLIYALGSHPPPPLHLPTHLPTGDRWERTKTAGLEFLARQGQDLQEAGRVVVIGGGALGIQYATDIASLYPRATTGKKVTLVHSRQTFLPIYSPLLDQAVKESLDRLGVERVMGERVDMASLREGMARGGVVKVKTLAGREIEADYVLLCTGQTPNTELMASFCPLAVPGGSQGGGAIQVHRSMQIAPSPLGPSPVVAINLSASTGSKGEVKRLWEFDEVPRREVTEEDEERMWRRTFAVGDCADAFGAIKAGHTGWNQAEVAAKNVLRMIRWEERGGTVEEMEPLDEGEDVPGEGYKLERYEPNLPMMKLTLGLGSSISQLVSMTEPGKVEVTKHETGPVDANWQHQWRSMGLSADCDGWD